MSKSSEALNQDLVEQLRETQALLHISQMLARSMDLPTILRQIVDASVSLIPHAEQSVIHLIDEAHSQLKPAAVARPDSTSVSSPLFFRPGEGIAGLVIASGNTINVRDTSQDDRFLPQSQTPPIYRSLLVAPIKLNEKTIGTLSVESSIANAFTQKHERLLTSLGEQAALAIERAQILQEEQDQRQLAEALKEASNIQGSNASFQYVLAQILNLARRVLAYDVAWIMLIEDGFARIAQRIVHPGADGAPEQNSPQVMYEIKAVPQLEAMVSSGQPIIVQDTIQEANWIYQQEGARSWAGAPIQAKGAVIGFLSFCKKEARFYDPSHVERITAFANQASLTIQNAQLFETTQQRLREVNLLYRISQQLAESLDTDVILQQVTRWLQEQFGFYAVQVLLLDPSGKNLIYRQGSMPDSALLVGKVFPLSSIGIPGHVAITNQPFVSNHVKEVPFYTAYDHLPLTTAELAVPLRTRDKLLGVLDIHHKFPDEFKQQDLQLIYTIAEQITLAIEKSILYDDLQKTLAKEQAARAQLVQSEKLAALGRIVASVAHELNNPLQAIQNALYLINMEENLNEQAREDLQVAINEADRMAGLIARLRETYRPATSEEFQRCSINQLVIDVEKLIGAHLRRNNVAFKFIPDPLLPEIMAIQDQIKQVVLNISLNAVESMPKGGTLTISSHWEPEHDRIRLEITDTGSGIPADVLPYIFDPFVTTKDRGTGLGLAITYDIVRRHGGMIEPESQLGQGTTFRVWLPIQPSMSMH